jgi:hypothetical protein
VCALDETKALIVYNGNDPDGNTTFDRHVIVALSKITALNAPRGIPNLGQTCYANASWQLVRTCLSRVEPTVQLDRNLSTLAHGVGMATEPEAGALVPTILRAYGRDTLLDVTQVAEPFLNTLISALPDAVRRLFHVRTEQHCECQTCGKTQTKEPTNLMGVVHVPTPALHEDEQAHSAQELLHRYRAGHSEMWHQKYMIGLCDCSRATQGEDGSPARFALVLNAGDASTPMERTIEITDVTADTPVGEIRDALQARQPRPSGHMHLIHQKRDGKGSVVERSQVLDDDAVTLGSLANAYECIEIFVVYIRDLVTPMQNLRTRFPALQCGWKVTVKQSNVAEYSGFVHTIGQDEVTVLWYQHGNDSGDENGTWMHYIVMPAEIQDAQESETGKQLQIQFLQWQAKLEVQERCMQESAQQRAEADDAAASLSATTAEFKTGSNKTKQALAKKVLGRKRKKRETQTCYEQSALGALRDHARKAESNAKMAEGRERIVRQLAQALRDKLTPAERAASPPPRQGVAGKKRRQYTDNVKQLNKVSVRLHVGDTIAYNKPGMFAGSRQAARQSKILEIRPEAERPLILQSNDLLEKTDFVQLEKRKDGTRPDEKLRQNQPLENFTLAEGETPLDIPDARDQAMRDAQRLCQRIAFDGREFIAVCKEGTCTLEGALAHLPRHGVSKKALKAMPHVDSDSTTPAGGTDDFWSAVTQQDESGDTWLMVAARAGRGEFISRMLEFLYAMNNGRCITLVWMTNDSGDTATMLGEAQGIGGVIRPFGVDYGTPARVSVEVQADTKEDKDIVVVARKKQEERQGGQNQHGRRRGKKKWFVTESEESGTE